MILTGPRVTLRPWREADRPAFAEMNADPEVMRHFPARLTREESDAFMDRLQAHQASHGFCMWAVEHRGELAGLCGLAWIPWEACFTPAVEIGWRFRTAFQRQGLAAEAARLALGHGFGVLALPRIVAFTLPSNERSWRLMERLGMSRQGEFEHPRLPVGHPMRRHLLYALDRADWDAGTRDRTG